MIAKQKKEQLIITLDNTFSENPWKLIEKYVIESIQIRLQVVILQLY